MGRISELPLCIIEIILCLLPYQDVVKTSILSKEWRYHWTKIPKIVVIVDTCQPPLLKRKREQKQKQTMIKKSKPLFDICQTLLMHEGPIHEFNLYLKDEPDNVDEIDSIISHLSRKNTVKKMILDLNSRFIESLPLGNLPKEVPIALVHLKHLCIENIHFGQYNALRVMSLIIKRSSNLEKLKVKIKDDERRGEIMDFSYTIEEYTGIWMEHLSELEITYISSEQTE
ncbi:F-box/FBD/LRR-repeat protein [Tanacetum coccineum]